MVLPDYQDFLKTLTPDKIEEIMSDAKRKCLETSDFGSGGQSASISWTISIELLALYHIWLSDRLPDSLPDLSENP